MSAFMCSNKHINTLVNADKKHNGKHEFWMHGVRHTLTDTQFGQMLVDENAKAMRVCYHEDAGFNYKHSEDDADTSPGCVVKLAYSYLYQCSEHDDFDSSMAYKVVRDIISDMGETLTGYSNAAWSI